jgi:hypothetical protein
MRFTRYPKGEAYQIISGKLAVARRAVQKDNSASERIRPRGLVPCRTPVSRSCTYRAFGISSSDRSRRLLTVACVILVNSIFYGF